MKIPLREAVSVTLTYADIFGYPLTGAEIAYWLVGRSLTSAETKIGGKRQFYFLPGRGRLVALRRERESWSATKWQIARKIGGWLRLVPTLKLVGVTGGLAVNNAKKDDDIDLFLVTAQGTLWISRLVATILVEILGKRRRPGEQSFKDKICLNMFMAEDHLALTASERDLFAAHEILQMRPLWERDRAYQKFLKANAWVAKFLPNAWKEKVKSEKLKVKSELKGFLFSIWHLAFSILEPVARAFQVWYMRKRRTSEVISRGVIRFHPRDARVWVRQALRRRLRRSHVPLDKIFYDR
ncbi:MAG: hypothetical protein ACOY0S_03260 [Patescibacteria group bacterium]